MIAIKIERYCARVSLRTIRVSGLASASIGISMTLATANETCFLWLLCCRRCAWMANDSTIKHGRKIDYRRQIDDCYA